MPDNYLIIVAGGLGSRMRSELPKQFLRIRNKEIIVHVIDKFRAFDPSIKIIICVHPDYRVLLESILKEHACENIQITNGGDSRFASVKNGLDLIKDKNSVVGIHDAARPLVSLETIRRCYVDAKEKGNAIPCIPLVESIREVGSFGNRMSDRSAYRIIQTPQCFKTELIQHAFTQPYNSGFTDDASVLESHGKTIHLVEGNTENIKITNPYDLAIAEAIFNYDQR